VAPLNIDAGRVRELQESLMLFFIGDTRAAATLLHDQKTRSEGRDKKMVDDLHFTKQLGYEIERELTEGAIANFGSLMHEHWLRKRGRSLGMSSSHIDQLYELALSDGGVSGGKLVGAGGCGFLLLQTTDRRKLRQVMQCAGVHEMDFNFDFDGSVVMLRN
jgi:D-glycero-alpha-D-manno-heptose-7-phosphate kinase